MLCWSRLVGLVGLVLPVSLVLPFPLPRCFASHLLLPLLLLHEKLSLSASVLLRYSYVFCPRLVTSSCRVLLILTFTTLLLLLLLFPFLTFTQHLPSLLQTCLQLPPSPSPAPSSLSFLPLYLLTWLATLLIDIFCYVRIINYMRLSSVRINVLPDTDSERKKVVNLVTGSSSLLVWLVSLGSMLPCLLLTHQLPSSPHHHQATTHYQLLAIGVLNSVVPLLYIGSSLELRVLVGRVRQRLEAATLVCCTALGLGGEEVPRAELYTLPDPGQRVTTV